MFLDNKDEGDNQIDAIATSTFQEVTFFLFIKKLLNDKKILIFEKLEYMDDY